MRLFVVLDEATAVLTQKTKQIQAALAQLCKGKTVLEINIVSQQLEEADQIFFLRDDVLQNRGTHEELICTAVPTRLLLKLVFDVLVIGRFLSNGEICVEGQQKNETKTRCA